MTGQAGHGGPDCKPGAEIVSRRRELRPRTVSLPDSILDDCRSTAVLPWMTDSYGRTWAQTGPDLWRSTDGRYTIHRSVLPEPRPALAVIYTLRWCEPMTAAAWPGHLGCEIGTANPAFSLSDAQQEAAAHARALAAAPGNDRALQDLPSLATEMFFWPISEGLTRAALTVTLDGGRLRARVTGMSCQAADPQPAGTWAPGTYAEIDITGLRRQVLAARVRRFLRLLHLAGQG